VVGRTTAWTQEVEQRREQLPKARLAGNGWSLPRGVTPRTTASQTSEPAIIMLKEHLEIVAGKESKHIKTIIGNGYGVFPLRRQAAVPGQDCPAIRE